MSASVKPRLAGRQPSIRGGARPLPIYQTTSFVFPSAESAANRFALAELAPIYTRIGNPTQDAVEQRIASLEGGLAAHLLSSGQAAETFAILNIAEAGDHVVASPSLYGGTYNLLAHTLKKFGISVTFVEDPDNLSHSHVANIGDVRSLVIHPASTTHSQLSPPRRFILRGNPATGSHKPVTLLAIHGAGFVHSEEVMSASDSPGLLAGNPPSAAGCPG